MLTAVIIFEVIFLVGAVISVDHQSDFFSGLFTLLGLGTLIFVTGFNPQVLLDDIWYIIGGFVAWFAVGALWALFKWWAWINSSDVQSAIRAAKDNWTNSINRYIKNANDEDSKKRLQDELDAGFAKADESRFWRPGQNKARIVRWVVWWPFSLIWSMTYRLVENISRWIYDRIVDVLNAISNAGINKATK